MDTDTTAAEHRPYMPPGVVADAFYDLGKRKGWLTTTGRWNATAVARDLRLDVSHVHRILFGRVEVTDGFRVAVLRAAGPGAALDNYFTDEETAGATPEEGARPADADSGAAG